MADQFPVISGSVVRYPPTRKRNYRTSILVSADCSEQRYAAGVILEDFELAYTNIKTSDKELVRTFWNDRFGSFDTSWTLIWNDIPGGGIEVWNNLQFLPGQQFEATEDRPGLWSFKLRIRQRAY